MAARFNNAAAALNGLARVAHGIGARPAAAGIARLAVDRPRYSPTATVAAARVLDADVAEALAELRDAGGVIVANVNADLVELP